MVTVLDIIMIYVSIPHFFYLLYINCKTVKLSGVLAEEQEQEQERQTNR